MNWFTRHLNWTAVLVSIAGISVTFLLSLFAQGLNFIPRINLMPFEFKIYLTLVVLFSSLATVICMVLLIKKKQLNILISLLFVFSLSFSPVLFYLLMNNETKQGPGYHIGILLLISVFLAIIWAIGLIIFLFLKPKILDIENHSLSDDQDVRNKTDRKLFSSAIFVSLILAAILSFVSFMYMNVGKQRITEYSKVYPEEGLHYLEFSFECPNSYYSPWTSDIITYPGHIFYFTRNKIKPFKLVGSILEIHITQDVYDGGDPVYDSLIKQSIYFYYQNTNVWLRHFYEIKDIFISTIIIDGTEAEYATFLVGDFNGFDYTPVKMVCFERNNDIWTLIMTEDEPTILNSDFNQITQTFDIR
jgi:hypothetical protein